MIESEINFKNFDSDFLHEETIAKFTQTQAKISASTALVWGEHCTECAVPHCYQTCGLYQARIDGKCRRFKLGIQNVKHSNNTKIYKVIFKKWGKWWSKGSTQLFDIEAVDQMEKKDLALSKLIGQLPIALQQTAIKHRYERKKNKLTQLTKYDKSDGFLLEIYNPNAFSVSITIEFFPEVKPTTYFYQKQILIQPGYESHLINQDQIEQKIDLKEPFSISVIPNIEEETSLYFGKMEFVKMEQNHTLHNIKCIVWDLDQTLWHGILTEDGEAQLKLKPEILHYIHALDEKGILQSIASKNEYDRAYNFLKSHNLEQFFLFPQIGWQPKSQMIAQIAKDLNIDINSLCFIDDSAFERAEVAENHKAITNVDALDCQYFLSKLIENTSVSDEMKYRRISYQNEILRKSDLVKGNYNYEDFLVKSAFKISISRLSVNNIDRVYELTQRTNQLNFAGNRYSMHHLEQIAKDSKLQSLVINCSDKYGNYGTVGFAVLDQTQNLLQDFMLSCRVQSKRVEHSIINYLLQHNNALSVYYKPTERNKALASFLHEMGFVQQNINTTYQVFNLTKERLRAYTMFYHNVIEIE